MSQSTKKRKKRRRVILGSRSRRARQKLNSKKQTSSTESSSEGDEREEEEEGEESAMETSQSDGEPRLITMKIEPEDESIGQRLRVRSRSGSTSDLGVVNKKRNWNELSEVSQEEEEEEVEAEVSVDSIRVELSQLRPKLPSSMKPVNQVANGNLDIKPVLTSPHLREGKPLKKRKRIPYTLVEASKGNHCPTPGCDGLGHLTGMYAMHFAVSGCPKAHGKTPDECRARREELNRLRLKAIPPVVLATTSSVDANEGHSERLARRVSRVTGGNSPPIAPPTHIRRSSSHVSMQHAQDVYMYCNYTCTCTLVACFNWSHPSYSGTSDKGHSILSITIQNTSIL